MAGFFFGAKIRKPVNPEQAESKMIRQAFIIENLRKYETLKELRKSVFFSDYREQIESILKTPQVFSFPGSTPFLQSFLRVAQWNIEKGKRFREILDRLQTDEVLKWADVVILNEADQGMNRSQNRHVALCLAQNLGMNMVFGPAYFELTKGTEDDLVPEGENSESLQGNAVLSRYPVLDSRLIPLPGSFEPYEFPEKRFGWRNCLWVLLQLRKSSIWVGSVHLELRNTPRCRAAQIRHLMEHLPGRDGDAYVLGGDLNTNSFRRGTTWRTIQSVLRVLFSTPDRMNEQLLHPECGSEPLFKVLERSGFDWRKLNSSEETARAAIDSLEEASFLPAPLMRVFRKRLEPYHGYLCFKLDWLLGRSIQALSSSQRRDMKTGVASLDPASAKGLNSGPGRTSDHLPIYVDLDLS